MSKSSSARAARPEAEARSQFVSHFTPGLMTPRVLEAIFVGRAVLADRLMESVRSSATTNAKQQTLLIAPRGFGKSHLVALIYHRIQAEKELTDRLRVAWLREEEWGITSFLDVLLRIYRALNEQYPGELPTKEWNSLYELDEVGAQAKAIDLLREFIGERTLLVLLENADDVFAGLGDSGQKQWRAFLQENNFCSTLMTSPSLFNGVARRESPFFGFFRVIHLDPLSLDEAVELLHRLATLRGDQELADFLLSSVGRARVRAIHHLAGGNPRVYVIFAQFLTRQTLDELVEPFFKMLDDLTPYYQSRMKLISPQQRKIIEFLCDYRGAAAVKMVASRGFMTQQTASGQLLDLKDKGYVVPRSIGRETFYELREPLMRLCIEVKKNRGEPIGLLVDFLRLWYPVEQLQQQLVGINKTHTLERIYLQHAIQRATEEVDPRIIACQEDAKNFIKKGSFQAALQAQSDLIALHPAAISYLGRAVCYWLLESRDAAERDASHSIVLEPKLLEGWELRALIREEQGQLDLALGDWNHAIELTPSPFFLLHRASILMEQDQRQEAYIDIETALSSQSEKGTKDYRLELSSYLWLEAASIFHESGQVEKAKQSLRLAAYGKGKSWELYSQISLLWQNLEEPVYAIDALSKIIELNPYQFGARMAKALLEIRNRRYAAARKTLNQSKNFCTDDGVLSEDFQRLILFQAVAEIAAGDVKRGVGFLEETALFFVDEQANWDLQEKANAGAKRSIALRQMLLHLLWEYVPKNRWLTVCPKIVSFFRLGGRVLLQISLTNIIPLVVANLSPEEPQNTKASAWLEAWKAAVGEREELQLAIRLTETAIRYRQTLDERILLELPIEERTVLEEKLGEIEVVRAATA